MLEAVVSGKGRLLAGDRDGTEDFHYVFLGLSTLSLHLNSTLILFLKDGHCSHIMTQCTPHI